MRVRSIAATLLALVHQLASAGVASQVEVFTLSTVPLTNASGATVHYLDAVALLEQHLSASLPTDPQQAQALAGQRITALGPQLKARAAAGATGLARAAQLGICRAPAIVFDGRWVVYGLTDVAAARRVFEATASGAETTR
jgi:integrating conjugative element protein (TIGR03757 family)